jgi:transposase
MARLNENQRVRAIGMFQAGLAQRIVARHFGVHRKTKQSLLRRFGPSTFRSSTCDVTSAT